MQTIRRNLSRYRNELKGLAILWVVFFHAELGLDGLLYQIQRIGYGGVDIFFFMSGFGLFYSLQKDAHLGRYMLRRAERLLPAFLPFSLMWLAVMLPLNGAGVATSMKIAVSNASMLGFLTGAPLYINWYTGALLVSLVLAPYFFEVLKPGKNYWLRATGLLAVLMVVGLGYISDYSYILVSRLPVMVLGMVAAGCDVDECRQKWLIPGLIAACAVALPVLYRCLNHYQELLVTYAMYWHPFIVIAPAVCVVASWILSAVRGSWLKPLRMLGEASFEIFLFNAWVEKLSSFGWLETAAEWLVWSVVSVFAGIVYHLLVKKTQKYIREKFEKRG